MRQLQHPEIKDVTVEGILYAFSDPIRVQIFMELAGSESAKSCATFANITNSPLAKSTLSQHFRILREAGLIFSERKGVELQNRTRCAELRENFGEMLQAIAKAYKMQQENHKR